MKENTYTVTLYEDDIEETLSGLRQIAEIVEFAENAILDVTSSDKYVELNLRGCESVLRAVEKEADFLYTQLSDALEDGLKKQRTNKTNKGGV